MKGLGRFLRNFLIGVPISITFVDCVGYVAKVDGVSMQPVLNPEENRNVKDFVLLNRWSVRKYNIERGDIVSLASPRDPDIKIVKRVIALEGDTIRTLNYKKRYVNIPQGYCWVEGDHHRNSMDSNFFGPVSVSLITAKASHIVWPPHRWQRLVSALPSDRAPLRSQDLPHNNHLKPADEDDEEEDDDEELSFWKPIIHDIIL